MTALKLTLRTRTRPREWYVAENLRLKDEVAYLKGEKQRPYFWLGAEAEAL